MRLLHIGRATTNDIVIADTTVSRQHAQLMIDDIGQATLIDLNSSNGTFVNGRRISTPTRLDPTDIVKVGEYMLPWRQYLQGSPVTPAGQTGVAQPPVSYSSPIEPPPSSTRFPKLILGIVAGAVVLVILIVVAIFAFSGGNGQKELVGKWYDKEDREAWIEFSDGGKYTEGYKNAVVYDSATWKAMGVDRILIEKGNIELSKRYKFDGDDLLITYNKKVTTYERGN